MAFLKIYGTAWRVKMPATFGISFLGWSDADIDGIIVSMPKGYGTTSIDRRLSRLEGVALEHEFHVRKLPIIFYENSEGGTTFMRRGTYAELVEWILIEVAEYGEAVVQGDMTPVDITGWHQWRDTREALILDADLEPLGLEDLRHKLIFSQQAPDEATEEL